MASTDSKELGVEMQTIDAELGDENVDVPGTHISAKSMGTAYDQRDMRVMGKLQELRVRNVFKRRCAHPLTTSAKLPLYFHSRLCLHADEHLGDCPRIDGLCSRKWRFCRIDMDFCDCCSGLLLCVRVFG